MNRPLPHAGYRLHLLLAALCAVFAAPSAARAQSPDASRLELGVGLRWTGREELGTKSATETTGAGGTSTLFTTQSDLGGAAGLEGRVGLRLGGGLTAEAEASYLKPQLRIAVSADAEGALSTAATETIEQFTIGGGVAWRLPGRRWSPRFVPFIGAGGGYMRQLHEQGTFVQTGRYYQVGGGVNARLVTSRRFHTKGIGLRADLRALIRSGGVGFDESSKVSPSAGVSLFVRF